jgi:glutamate synthase (NADPH/NADH) large chain
LVSRHAEETDSSVAKELLADWPAATQRFTKVLPRDFARVVQIRGQAEAEGLDPDGTVVWERIMEASRG